MKPAVLPERSMLDELRESGLARDLEGRIEQRVRHRAKRRTNALRVASVAVLLILGSGWLVPWVRSTDSIVTASGHRQSVTLPDGSTVHLNARTILKTDFRYGRRVVRLERGEAFFSVVKDSGHVFRVETPLGGRVEVHGTEFNVRLATVQPGLEDTEVTLFTGSVSLRTKFDDPVELRPGEQGSSSGTRPLSEAELESIASWRSGRLVLDGLPLAEIAGRFAAYHNVVLTVDPRVASLALSGSLPLDDLDRFLTTLKTTEALHVLTRGDGSCHIAPR